MPIYSGKYILFQNMLSKFQAPKFNNQISTNYQIPMTKTDN